MLCDSLVIRPSRKSDEAAIAAVQTEAFGRPAEARLALDLMAGPMATISLVAECEGRVIGHVLLSEIGAPLRAAALAPLGVLAQFREMQIGSRLVRAAIEQGAAAGFEAIFVLGDNLYYERFGFLAQSAAPFEVEWQGPHFMALELKEGALAGKSGRLVYPDAFRRV